MGYNFGDDLIRHAPKWGTEYKSPPDTIWAIYEFRKDGVEDIIGYFYTEEDAKRAKKFWKKKDYAQKGSRVEVYEVIVWRTSKEFKEFWKNV